MPMFIGNHYFKAVKIKIQGKKNSQESKVKVVDGWIVERLHILYSLILEPNTLYNLN